MVLDQSRRSPQRSHEGNLWRVVMTTQECKDGGPAEIPGSHPVAYNPTRPQAVMAWEPELTAVFDGLSDSLAETDTDIIHASLLAILAIASSLSPERLRMATITGKRRKWKELIHRRVVAVITADGSQPAGRTATIWPSHDPELDSEAITALSCPLPVPVDTVGIAYQVLSLLRLEPVRSLRRAYKRLWRQAERRRRGLNDVLPVIPARIIRPHVGDAGSIDTDDTEALLGRQIRDHKRAVSAKTMFPLTDGRPSLTQARGHRRQDIHGLQRPGNRASSRSAGGLPTKLPPRPHSAVHRVEKAERTSVWAKLSAAVPPEAAPSLVMLAQTASKAFPAGLPPGADCALRVGAHTLVAVHLGSIYHTCLPQPAPIRRRRKRVGRARSRCQLRKGAGIDAATAAAKEDGADAAARSGAGREGARPAADASASPGPDAERNGVAAAGQATTQPQDSGGDSGGYSDDDSCGYSDAGFDDDHAQGAAAQDNDPCRPSLDAVPTASSQAGLGPALGSSRASLPSASPRPAQPAATDGPGPLGVHPLPPGAAPRLRRPQSAAARRNRHPPPHTVRVLDLTDWYLRRAATPEPVSGAGTGSAVAGTGSAVEGAAALVAAHWRRQTAHAGAGLLPEEVPALWAAALLTRALGGSPEAAATAAGVLGGWAPAALCRAMSGQPIDADDALGRSGQAQPAPAPAAVTSATAAPAAAPTGPTAASRIRSSSPRDSSPPRPDPRAHGAALVAREASMHLARLRHAASAPVLLAPQPPPAPPTPARRPTPSPGPSSAPSTPPRRPRRAQPAGTAAIATRRAARVYASGPSPSARQRATAPAAPPARALGRLPPPSPLRPRLAPRPGELRRPATAGGSLPVLRREGAAGHARRAVGAAVARQQRKAGTKRGAAMSHSALQDLLLAARAETPAPAILGTAVAEAEPARGTAAAAAAADDDNDLEAILALADRAIAIDSRSHKPADARQLRVHPRDADGGSFQGSDSAQRGEAAASSRRLRTP